MPNAVKRGATFECPHSPGVGSISAASDSLEVGASEIVTKTEALTMAIASCPHVQVGPPIWVPCTALTSVSDESTTLKKGGVGVVLEDSTLVTNSLTGGVPDLGTISISNNQSTLRG